MFGWFDRSDNVGHSLTLESALTRGWHRCGADIDLSVDLVECLEKSMWLIDSGADVTYRVDYKLQGQILTCHRSLPIWVEHADLCDSRMHCWRWLNVVMEAPYDGVIAGCRVGVESLAVATETERIKPESIRVMLNSLGWTRDGVFISVRDCIMLMRVPSMQCYGRLKRMQEVVVVVVASCNRLGSKAVDLGINVPRFS
ncbi:hypothetical protein TIFTF001_040659 [Ficus carica]|uniref:Uncharacterized protein n=1 Tax=Ficus carica TaxID=3494 RepID=A0AA88CKN8_FICCA|nr:hypothetical protein TIFTF001_040659 [Ficus carica]